MTAQHLSVKGAQFIANFEGFSATWYHDPVGVPTIGYGHAGPLPPGYHEPLTKVAALHLLIHDAEKVAAVVREIRPHVVMQSRFDALVSFGYNLGPGELLSPTSAIGHALRLDSAKRIKPVAAALLLYDHAGGKVLPGLKTRREAERTLWLDGKY